MFKLIKSLPDNVLGIEASGVITEADYKKVLMPEAQKRLARHDMIRLLYVAGRGFAGYDARAIWSDAVFGVKHWRNFSRIAVVTDTVWLRNAVNIFAPFFPGQMRVFPLARRAAAKTWIVQKNKNATKRDMIQDEIAEPILYNFDETVKAEERRYNKASTAKKRKK